MRTTAKTVRRLLAPLSRRVRLLVSRGVVRLVNDSLKCQHLQVSLLANETAGEAERFQEYGFTSHPFEGAEALYLSVGGNRDHGIVACVTDRRYRPKSMAEGDVCLFTDKGERVYLERAADVLNLGEKTADDWLAKAGLTKTELEALQSTLASVVADLNTLKGFFNTWFVIPNDGGAALKTLTAAWATSTISAPAAVGDVKTSKVKAT